jgi:hypothetical protein
MTSSATKQSGSGTAQLDCFAPLAMTTCKSTRATLAAPSPARVEESDPVLAMKPHPSFGHERHEISFAFRKNKGRQSAGRRKMWAASADAARAERSALAFRQPMSNDSLRANLSQ